MRRDGAGARCGLFGEKQPRGDGGTPLALLPDTVTHTVQLEQIRWEKPADFNTMSNFSVKITRNGQTVVYTGCEWTAVEEESRRPLIWLRATLTARQRTEGNGDAGDK